MKTIFFGSSEFSLPVLESLLNSSHPPVLVVTQPDKQKGRGKKLLPNMVKTYALEQGVPVWTPATLRSEETEEKLRSVSYDVAVVASYGKIIPPNLLAIPRYGYINVHSSLLPKYRGASPIHAAILHNDTITGISIMQMDEGLDTGAVFSQVKIPLEEEDDIISLTEKLAKEGGKELITILNSLPKGSVIPVKQNEKEASYTQKVKKEDGKINWHEPAEEICRKARAYRNWPGIFSFYKGKKVFFEKITAVTKENAHAQPGEIVAVDKTSILIQTPKGCIAPLEVKVAGKKSINIRGFIAGYRPAAGDCFKENSPR